jgi:hypothetical protein
VSRGRPIAVAVVLAAAAAAAAATAAWRAKPAEAPSPKPALFGEGVFSTPADEFGAALSPDGVSAFFNRSVPRSQLYTIFRTRRSGATPDSSWQRPEVASFSGRWRDFDPVFGPSGRLYFISDRPRPGAPEDGEYNVWVLDDPSSAGAAPRALGPPVNGSGSVHFASETADGTLYICASREDGTGPSDVYRVAQTADGWAAPASLGPSVNGPAWLNLEAYVSADESVLVVSAYGHDDGFGDSDLYASRRCGGTWRPLVNLGEPVNGAAREYSPRITQDGRTLLYASERGLPTEPRKKGMTYDELVRRIRGVENGLGNIYAIPLDAALARVPPCGATPAR